MIYFVRHGRTKNNDIDKLSSNDKLGLTELGKSQVKELHNFFMYKNPKIILTSPSPRAIETANILNEKLNIEIKIFEQLKERCFGKYENMLVDDLLIERKKENHKFDDITQDWDNVSEVESDKSVFNRIKDLILQFERNYDELIVVTHAGVIKSVLHTALKIDNHKSNCFKVRNSSVTVLSTIKENSMLLGLYNYKL